MKKIISLLLSAAVACSILSYSLGVSADSPNLLENGSFEDGIGTFTKAGIVFWRRARNLRTATAAVRWFPRGNRITARFPFRRRISCSSREAENIRSAAG